MKWVFLISVIFLLSSHKVVKSSPVGIKDSLLYELSNSHQVNEKIQIYFELSKLLSEKDIDSSRLITLRALRLSEEIESLPDIAYSYNLLGLYSVQEDSLERGITEYSKAKDIYLEIDDNHSYLDILVIIGNIYFVKGNYPQAMEYYMEALEGSKSINYQEKLPHCFNNIGVIFHQQSDFNQALNNFVYSLDLFDKLGDTLHVALIMGNIGSIYSNLGEFQIAKQYYNKSILLYEELKDVDGEITSLNQLADLYNQQGHPDSAITLLSRSDSLLNYLAPKLRGPKVIKNTDIQLELGNSFFLKKDYRNAIKHLKEAFDLAVKTKMNVSIREASLILSNAYDSIGNLDSAFSYFKIFNHFSDSILNEDNIRNMALLEYRFEIEQQKIENELIEKDREAFEARRTLLLLFVMLCLLILSFIFILLYVREKIKKAKLKVERKQLQTDLEYKNKELTTHMLYLLKKNEFIMSISQKLKNILPLIKAQNKKSIADVVNELNAGSANDTWKEFEVRFQEVYISFFDNLNKHHPDLSPNELKLCAFLKLNMTTKDISSITYQSLKSIETARFRLRKKLNIESNEHLVSYLSQF